MSAPIDDGGPAFPNPELSREHFGNFCGYPGMTLRDWFAGQALVMIPHIGCGADLDTEGTAIAAYQVADAMIAARAK